MLVDSGASGHYFDDSFTPGLRYKLTDYQVLETPRNIPTARGHRLEEVERDLLRGNAIDGDGVQRFVQLLCLVMPGLGHHVVSVKPATRNGVESIFDTDNPRLEANGFTLPLQELGSDLKFFSLDLTDGRGASELAIQATADATLRHRRLEHVNRKSLDLLKKRENSGASFDGTLPAFDVCALGRVTSWFTPLRLITRSSTPFS